MTSTLTKVREKKRNTKDLSSKCWEYPGHITSKGYARRKLNKKQINVHRAIYETLNGAVDKSLTLDHLCRNRKCVNPFHLEPVDNKTNILRGEGITANNARKTHCPKGHVLFGKNLAINLNGSRVCRACKFDTNRRYRLKVLGVTE